jgi:hypothetical protein
MRYGVIYIVAFFCILLGAPLAKAQTIDPFGGIEPLQVTLSPEFPQPHTTFTVTPESTLIDLTNAKITVTLNGKVIAEVTGKKPIRITAGAPGEPLLITLTAVIDGQSYVKRLPLYLEDAVVIVEPQSTIPPFYRGAALLPAQTRSRIVVIPNFQTASGRIPTKDLSYQWSVGVRQLQEFSGIGRSVLIIEGPLPYRDAGISVIITSQDKRYIAYAEVSLQTIDSTLRVYRTDPLLGPLFVPALKDRFTMKGLEQSFIAVPYFFKEGPTLTWRVNGSTSGGDTITVRAVGGVGVADLRLQAQGSDVFSIANFFTSIQFSAPSPKPSIFGL